MRIHGALKVNRTVLLPILVFFMYQVMWFHRKLHIPPSRGKWLHLAFHLSYSWAFGAIKQAFQVSTILIFMNIRFAVQKLPSHIINALFSAGAPNSPNSALHWSHVTWAIGWTLRDKCFDNYTCISVAWVRLGLPMAVN